MATHRTGHDGRVGSGDAARIYENTRSARSLLSAAGQVRVSRAQGSAREASLVDRIERYLKRQPGCLVRKTHGSAYSAGVADLIGCLKGRYFEIEVKRPGEQPTALQLRGLEDVRKAGGYGMWTDCYEDIVQFVREAS